MEVFKERDYFIENEEPRPWILNAGEGWAEKYEPEPNTVIVSITEPVHPGNQLKRQEPARLKPGYVDILRMEFHDMDPGRMEIPKGYVIFTQQQSSQLARFLRKHRGKNIVVHCAAGVSRSGAVVEAALEAFPEYEDKGWQRHPNTHIKNMLKRSLGLVPIGYEEEENGQVS